MRWALEEAGIPYRVTLVGDGEGLMTRPGYRVIQPFGQIPAMEDDGLTLFESGAIVFYVAERSRTLLPDAPSDRAHVVQWMFAALNTIEVPILRLAEIDLFYGEERWARERRPAAVQAVQQRLAELAAALADRAHLVGGFSAADILMTSVLRILRHTNVLEAEPALVAYKQRCEARPAFARALAGQLGSFQRRDERAPTSA